MKKIYMVVLSVGIFCCSCQQKVERNENKQELTMQAEITAEKPVSVTEQLVSVDDSYIEAWDTLHTKKMIADKKVYKLAAFTRLKSGQDQFTYYILKELNWGNSFRSYLIYEYYESESAVWLANYTPTGDFIDAIEVYYDNAEGAISTNAKLNLSNHLVELTLNNIYTDPETTIETIKVTPNGKFKK